MVIQTSIKLKPLWTPRRSCLISPRLWDDCLPVRPPLPSRRPKREICAKTKSVLSSLNDALCIYQASYFVSHQSERAKWHSIHAGYLRWLSVDDNNGAIRAKVRAKRSTSDSESDFWAQIDMQMLTQTTLFIYFFYHPPFSRLVRFSLCDAETATVRMVLFICKWEIKREICSIH